MIVNEPLVLSSSIVALPSSVESAVLEKDDVHIEMTQKEGFVASSDKGITVVMDTNLTPELIEEAFLLSHLNKNRSRALFLLIL